MDSRRFTVALVAFLMTIEPLTARANAFDNEILCRNIDNILKRNSAQHLLNVEERSNLRNLLKFTDVEGIDRMVAPKAAIEITINPEARVSVRRTSAHFPLFACKVGEPLLIRIVNQGRVSSNLNLRLLEDVGAKMVMLEPIKPHLSGAGVVADDDGQDRSPDRIEAGR